MQPMITFQCACSYILDQAFYKAGQALPHPSAGACSPARSALPPPVASVSHILHHSGAQASTAPQTAQLRQHN